jgi:hypothetical protein
MRRALAVLLPLLAPAAVAARSPAPEARSPAAAASPARAPAAARLTLCDREERAAEFEARMDAIAGAARLQLRFRLQVASPGAPRWAPVVAPGFGTWQTADRGVRRYVYTRRVEGLAPGARYRVVVAFRWLDASGERVARARRVTRACRQPPRRPPLD